IGRLWRLKMVLPDWSASEMLPLPATLLPNPLFRSCAVMVMFKVAGPALVSTESGEMLNLTNCGGVLSAAAELANKANTATAPRRRGKQRSIKKRSMEDPHFSEWTC